MSSYFDDPDAAIERVQADIAAAQERAVKAAEVKQTLDRLRGRARSPRGEVGDDGVPTSVPMSQNQLIKAGIIPDPTR